MIHPDWPAFVSAITAEPTDDTPRLVAADFLEENGDPDRAAFIRIQIELARLEASQLGALWEAEKLRSRERVFLGPKSFHLPLWAAEECPELVSVMPTAGGLLHVEGAEQLTWRRGFVDAVRCPAAKWLRHGAAVRARNPVQRVWLDQCYHLPREQWYAHLGALRGLATVEVTDYARSDIDATVFAAWLQGWLPGTEVRLPLPF